MGATCPCGASTVQDTIADALRLDGAGGVCAACGGPLPGIPFAWLQRLLAEDDAGVLR